MSETTPGTETAAPDPEAAEAITVTVRDNLLAAIGAQAAHVAGKPAGEAATALAGLARAYARVVGGRRLILTTEADREATQDAAVAPMELPPAAAQARMALLVAIEEVRQGRARQGQEPDEQLWEHLLDLADAYGTVTSPPLDGTRDPSSVFLRLTDASGKFDFTEVHKVRRP